MNEIDSASPDGMQQSERLRLWSVISVLAAGMLAYEILLTRIASLLLTSDHLFFVIGLALLGIAIGAIFDYWLASGRGLAGAWNSAQWLVLNGLAMAAGLTALIELGPAGGTAVLAMAAAIPFVFAGLLFSRIFRRHHRISSSLYAADLVGASVGALLVPALISNLGPIQAVLLIASVQCILGAALTIRSARGLPLTLTMIAAIICVTFAATNYGFSLLGSVPVGEISEKDLYRMGSNSRGGVKFIESRWSTFGRTDLVIFPGRGINRYLFIDGAAGSPMLAFDGDVASEINDARQMESSYGGSLPSLLQDSNKELALVIGPGGGRDVVFALQAGFERVIAVEINPQVISLVKDYEEFNGGIFTRLENVEVVNEEGRAFLEESEQQYDLITLFLPVTKSSRSRNAFALSECFLFTTDAFASYYQHLTDGGQLFVMAHRMEDAIKLTTTAVHALQEVESLSVTEAMNRVFLLGSQMMPFFGLSRGEIEEPSRDRLHVMSQAQPFDPVLSYVPGRRLEESELRLPADIDQQPVNVIHQLLHDVAEGEVPVERLETGLGLNMEPVSDDRPFFFQYDFALPALLVTIFVVSGAVLLLLVVGPSILILRHSGGSKRTRRDLAGVLVWVSAIGVGFIVIELALFQKLIFFLGDPSRSVSIMLAALLCGAGIGSMVSSYKGTGIADVAGVASAGIAVLLIIVIDPLFTALRSAPDGIVLATAALLLACQGFPMGFLFPKLLRHTEKVIGASGIPWMWAINGTASVLGSAIAVILAMKLGYSWSLGFGAGCYALAAVAAGATVKASSSSDPRQIPSGGA